MAPAPRAARRAVTVIFLLNGALIGSWAARIPAVKEHLRLSPSHLGLLLLAIAAGSVVALPISGALVSRWGSRRTVAAMSSVLAAGFLVITAGYRVGVAPVVSISHHLSPCTAARGNAWWLWCQDSPNDGRASQNTLVE